MANIQVAQSQPPPHIPVYSPGQPGAEVWSIEEFEAITAQQRDQLQSADGLKHVPTLEIFMTQYPHIPAFTSMWTAAKAIPSFAKKTILEQFDWLRGEWRAYVKSKAGAVVKAASKLIVPMLAQNFFKIFAEWKPIMEVAGNLTIVMGQLVEAAVDDFKVAHNIAKDAGIPNDNAAEFVDGLSGNMAATLLINLVASHQKVLQQTDRTVELKWHADRHDMVAYMSVLESAAKAIGQLPSAELQFRLPTGDKSAPQDYIRLAEKPKCFRSDERREPERKDQAPRQPRELRDRLAESDRGRGKRRMDKPPPGERPAKRFDKFDKGKNPVDMPCKFCTDMESKAALYHDWNKCWYNPKGSAYSAERTEKLKSRYPNLEVSLGKY